MVRQPPTILLMVITSSGNIGVSTRAEMSVAFFITLLTTSNCSSELSVMESFKIWNIYGN